MVFAFPTTFIFPSGYFFASFLFFFIFYFIVNLLLFSSDDNPSYRVFKIL